LFGFKKESRLPLFLPNPELPDLFLLKTAQDRTVWSDGDYFVKRKFMTTSNAKTSYAVHCSNSQILLMKLKAK
jgi:hypothetical protein